MKIGTRVVVKEVHPIFNCGIKAIDQDMERQWKETNIYKACRENVGKCGVITRIDDYANYYFVEWDGKNGQGTWTPIECLEIEKLNCRVVCTINNVDGFTRGKIYEIKNGQLRDDDGDVRPMISYIRSMNEQIVHFETIKDLCNCYGKDSFIKIVE